MSVGQTFGSQRELTRLSWASSLPVDNTLQCFGPHKLRVKTCNIDIAQFVQPEVVRGRSCHHEIAISQLGVNRSGRYVELMKNPLLNKALFSGRLDRDINLMRWKKRCTR